MKGLNAALICVNNIPPESLWGSGFSSGAIWSPVLCRFCVAISYLHRCQRKSFSSRYLETCHLLGLHYALSRDRRRFPLAVPYFRMSGRPAVACLHSCLEEHFRGGGAGASVHLPPGLVSYVEEIVLRPSAPSENVLDAGLADAVIDLLGRHSHRTLAGLVLR